MAAGFVPRCLAAPVQRSRSPLRSCRRRHRRSPVRADPAGHARGPHRRRLPHDLLCRIRVCAGSGLSGVLHLHHVVGEVLHRLAAVRRRHRAIDCIDRGRDRLAKASSRGEDRFLLLRWCSSCRWRWQPDLARTHSGRSQSRSKCLPHVRQVTQTWRRVSSSSRNACWSRRRRTAVKRRLIPGRSMATAARPCQRFASTVVLNAASCVCNTTAYRVQPRPALPRAHHVRTRGVISASGVCRDSRGLEPVPVC